MLRTRVLAALLGLPMLFLLLWLNWFARTHGSSDDLFILLIVVLLAGISGWEVSRIVRHRFPETTPWNGVYAALIVPFLLHSIRPAFGGAHVGGAALLVDSLGATTAFMLLFLGVWGDIEQRGRVGWCENLFVVPAGLYLGITTSFLMFLGMTPFHELAVLFIFLAVFALDTAAYFGGKRFGGKHMAPHISPNKTWSGAVFGLLGACAMCLLFLFVPAMRGISAFGAMVPWWGLALTGLAIGITGQLGDLLESAFKRWGGVKDSGMVLPGHGGFLDRFDSLFLAAPVCYVLLRLFM